MLRPNSSLLLAYTVFISAYTHCLRSECAARYGDQVELARVYGISFRIDCLHSQCALARITRTLYIGV